MEIMKTAKVSAKMLFVSLGKGCKADYGVKKSFLFQTCIWAHKQLRASRRFRNDRDTDDTIVL